MLASLLRKRLAAAAGPLSRQTLGVLCQFSISQNAGSTAVEVCTTGYSFTTPSGRVAKYGIFWGKNDPRNVIREMPGKTHVAAMLMALIDAVRVARKDESLDKLSYASRDFHSLSGLKMKNADLLKDLYESTKDMNVVFKHRPAVENKKPNYVIESILGGDIHMSKPRGIGEELQANGEKSETPSNEWPHVYTTALCRTSKNGFRSASYATVWSEKRHGNDTMHRLAMVPVTLFRAQLAAIEEALKQAVDRRLTQVVVVTDSRAFMSSWQTGWVRADGASAPNKFLYDRIRDLTQAGVDVRFRYEPPQKDSVEWSLAVDKCVEAIDLPIVVKDRSEHNRNLKELLLHEKSLETFEVHKVRLFKKSPNFASKIVWDGSVAEIVNKSSEVERKTHHALLSVLEDASALALRQLIIRTDSPRLILAAENWLPVWQRSGWRNSLHKPIADADCWKKIWSLKKIVKVYWELMDPLDDSDKAAAQFGSVSISNNF